MAGEVGIILALPVVIFVVGGAKLDAYFDTSPLFVMIGVVLAATTSVVAMVRKINRVRQL